MIECESFKQDFGIIIVLIEEASNPNKALDMIQQLFHESNGKNNGDEFNEVTSKLKEPWMSLTNNSLIITT